MFIDTTAPTYPIFEVRYRVMTPTLALTTETELNAYGVYSTGIAEIDTDVFQQPQVVELPIERIAEIYNDSHNISILEREDTIAVYNAIQLYLSQWVHVLERAGINIMDVPNDDLLILERFANGLYAKVGLEFALRPPPVSKLSATASLFDLDFDMGSTEVEIPERQNYDRYFSEHKLKSRL